MTRHEFAELNPGDIIRDITTGDVFRVLSTTALADGETMVACSKIAGRRAKGNYNLTAYHKYQKIGVRADQINQENVSISSIPTLFSMD